MQEWMGHKDSRTTSIYADYAPDPSHGRTWAERAFAAGTNAGTKVNASEIDSDGEKPLAKGSRR